MTSAKFGGKALNSMEVCDGESTVQSPFHDLDSKRSLVIRPGVEEFTFLLTLSKNLHG